MADETPPPPKPTYRPWPKKRVTHINGNTQRVFDKEKIKEIYLNGQEYTWVNFCETNKFNPLSNTRQEFNFKTWQKEWLFRRMEEQDERSMSQAILSRANVMMRRALHPAEWIKLVESHKQLHQAMFAKMVRDFQHDQANAQAIEEKKIKPKSRLTPMGWTMFVQALTKLQEVERQTLLLTPQETPQMLGTPEIELKAEIEDTELLESYEKEPVKIMGVGAIPKDELTAVLSSWYDQQAATAHPDLPTTEVITPNPEGTE